MRDWLGKPLLFLLAVILVLGGISLWWVFHNPSSAGAAVSARAAEASPATSHHKQIFQTMREVETGR